MVNPAPEADWKRFRKVREAALETLSRRALEGAAQFSENDGRSHHERYLGLWKWLRRQDREMTRVFDGPRRSTMVISLAAMVGLGLVGDDDLAKFSQSTREAIEVLTGLANRRHRE